MASIPVEVNGFQFRSSEHAYQALRFPDHPRVQRLISSERSPMTAKKVAHDHISKTRLDWEIIKTDAMAFVLLMKAFQSAEFRSALVRTEHKDIVELSMKDPFWGASPNGDYLVGWNVLGNQLTMIRDLLYNQLPEPMLPDIVNFKLFGEDVRI